RKRQTIDPSATLDQAGAAAGAVARPEAHRLLEAYRRGRLQGNAAPPGGDERYGELVDRTGPEIVVRFAESSPDEPARPAGDVLRPLARLLRDIVRRKVEKYRGVKVDPVAHDLFGNPFRPAAIDPLWKAAAVDPLARGIYEDRAFDRLPILADALEEAGCVDPAILNHGRRPGVHGKGCWVLDLGLAKG